MADLNAALIQEGMPSQPRRIGKLLMVVSLLISLCCATLCVLGIDEKQEVASDLAASMAMMQQRAINPARAWNLMQPVQSWNIPQPVQHQSFASKALAETPDSVNDMQLRPAVAESLGRRHAGLAAALWGIATAAAPIRPVLAKGPAKPLIENLGKEAMNPAVADQIGPQGVKYVDVLFGKGAAPEEGSLVKVNYILKLAPTQEQVDQAKFFQFSIGQGEVIPGYELAVVGGDDMPPMKVGGTRKVLIPPELAYGKKGAGCIGDDQGRFPAPASAKLPGIGENTNFEANRCTIPPDTTLEFRIELVSIK